MKTLRFTVERVQKFKQDQSKQKQITKKSHCESFGNITVQIKVLTETVQTLAIHVQ